MKFVEGKKLPPSHLVKKVHGSTFQLPLPLDETLKCLPTPTQPIPKHGELFVLLRSLPSSNKIIWQDIVDIAKMYNALKVLKNINLLYSEINLPALPSALPLDSVTGEHVVEGEPKDGDEATDEASVRAMLKKVCKDEEEELYSNYTYYPGTPCT